MAVKRLFFFFFWNAAFWPKHLTGRVSAPAVGIYRINMEFFQEKKQISLLGDLQRLLQQLSRARVILPQHDLQATSSVPGVLSSSANIWSNILRSEVKNLWRIVRKKGFSPDAVVSVFCSLCCLFTPNVFMYLCIYIYKYIYVYIS